MIRFFQRWLPNPLVWHCKWQKLFFSRQAMEELCFCLNIKGADSDTATGLVLIFHIIREKNFVSENIIRVYDIVVACLAKYEHFL